MAPSAHLWQSDAVDALTAHLRDDEDVKALVLIGSYAYPDTEPDTWSDLDLVLVAEDGAVARFYPSSDWLAPLGRIYVSAPAESGHFTAIRTYFTDGRRIDVIILPESALAAVQDWDFNPFCYGARPLFSRSPALDSVLDRSSVPPAGKPLPPEPLALISQDFWFKAMLAAHKVARNDLLVALHLSLDLVRDCCVLGMMLRDRQAGTDHHRDGSAAQPLVDELTVTDHPYTAQGILNSIEQSGITFDGLASRLSERYQPNRSPLLRWVERVRRSLPEGN